MVEEMIVTLVDGGDFFKKLFVLHALSSFLMPTRKRTFNMSLAKVVSCVGEIKLYNWSEYVLDRFCQAQTSYKRSRGAHWHCGCVLLL